LISAALSFSFFFFSSFSLLIFGLIISMLSFFSTIFEEIGSIFISFSFNFVVFSPAASLSLPF